ncbi:hypothetical protein G7Y79_00004g013330 [Physcia stellaris]|nr:hypothetical protein G7Y79_00004g013330 [Physcia stellaris]
METPLLVRDGTQDMTEFWSPNRRPPRAPPSSPKLLPYTFDNSQRKNSSNRFQTLAYVDQQLEYTSPHTEAHCPKAYGTERPPRRFSFQSQCSSDEENRTTHDIQQQMLYCDDDDLTLIDTFSPTRSSVSEAHTLYRVSTNPSSEMLDSWPNGSPVFSPKFQNPWATTIPTRSSFATSTSTHPRSGMPKSTMQEHRVSCPLQTFTGQKTSPRENRSATPDLDMAIPLLNDDGERSQVSIFSMISQCAADEKVFEGTLRLCICLHMSKRHFRTIHFPLLTMAFPNSLGQALNPTVLLRRILVLQNLPRSHRGIPTAATTNIIPARMMRNLGDFGKRSAAA